MMSAPDRNGKRWGWCVAAGIALVAASCRRTPDGTVTAEFAGMGTTGTIVVPACNGGQARHWANLCLREVARLEAQLSVFRPDSDLARVNAAAGREAIAVAPEVWDLLQAGLAISRESGGAFDMTVGPLMRLWGFRGKTPPARVPEPTAIADALSRVGAHHVMATNGTVRLDAPDVALDAGGIGKGFAVDHAWTALRREGVRHALINLGGNMRSLGRPEPGRPWSVGVRNPFHHDQLLGLLELPDGMAVATSGHYERFVRVAGVRYAHLMDPRSGWPVQGMAGVTVVARSAMEADALSTALFVLGADAGYAMLRRTGRWAEALFVPDRMPVEIQVTPGVLEWFTPEPGVAVTTIRRMETVPGESRRAPAGGFPGTAPPP